MLENLKPKTKKWFELCGFIIYYYNEEAKEALKRIINGTYFTGCTNGTTYTFIAKCTRMANTRIDQELFATFNRLDS